MSKPLIERKPEQLSPLENLFNEIHNYRESIYGAGQEVEIKFNRFGAGSIILSSMGNRWQAFSFQNPKEFGIAINTIRNDRSNKG